MMQDVDRVLAEVAEQALAAGMDLESARDVLVTHMLGEQPLPVGARSRRRLNLRASCRDFSPSSLCS
jgi:hypothetical protein